MLLVLITLFDNTHDNALKDARLHQFLENLLLLYAHFSQFNFLYFGRLRFVLLFVLVLFVLLLLILLYLFGALFSFFFFQS